MAMGKRLLLAVGVLAVSVLLHWYRTSVNLEGSEEEHPYPGASSTIQPPPLTTVSDI